jgi:hypothetical protein
VASAYLLATLSWYATINPERQGIELEMLFQEDCEPFLHRQVFHKDQSLFRFGCNVGQDGQNLREAG